MSIKERLRPRYAGLEVPDSSPRRPLRKPSLGSAGLVISNSLFLVALSIRAISSVVEHLLHTQGVAGSIPASRIFLRCRMFYTYVLRCDDGELYIGSAADLRKRLAQHSAGRVRATAHRLPVRLEYYEACHSEIRARLREKQLKTGFGRAYLKRRLD